ncbi:Tap42 interacting protein [Rhodotorula kratochvilovae]
MSAPPSSSSSHRLENDPDQGQRKIHIHGWTVTTTKRPILSIPQADAASAELDLALPEICFGNNALAIRHEPTGFALEWNTLDMLRAVKKGDGWDALPGAGAVRVAHADEWTRGQAASDSTTDLTVQKPFDWTYTTLHKGRLASPSSPSSSSSAPPPPPPEWHPAPPTHPGIPLALLARTDIPILFFDEVPLFEDELGDNGIADVTVRVRVNHLSLFILSRFALRIDGVLFRTFDVRLFHRFGTAELLREIKGREAPYSAVRARLGPVPMPRAAPPPPQVGRASPAALRTPFAVPSPRAPSPASVGAEPAADLTPLTDFNWVAGVLEELALAEGVEGMRVGEGAGTGGGAGGSPGQWEGLGRRLEVMRAPWAANDGADASAQ